METSAVDSVLAYVQLVAAISTVSLCSGERTAGNRNPNIGWCKLPLTVLNGEPK